MNQLRKAVIDRIWRGRDPFQNYPDNLMEFDLQGWHSQHRFLQEAILIFRPLIVIEVGVWKGGSTVFMANHMKAANLAGVVIAVDTWLGSSEHWLVDVYFAGMSILNGYPANYQKFASNVVRSGVADTVVPLPVDSINASQIIQGANIVPDMIHLDASHDYDSVLSDLKAWWPLLRPGGLLVGDDYAVDGSWASVRQAFDDFFGPLGYLPLENTDSKCRLTKRND